MDAGRCGMRAGKAGSLDCRIVRELTGILCANGREGRILDARKALRAGDKKVAKLPGSSAARKQLDTFAGGGLQGLEE